MSMPNLAFDLLPNRLAIQPGTINSTWAMKNKGPWLFRVWKGDAILPRYNGIIIDHYKDPY